MDQLIASREWMWWASCWCHVGRPCSSNHVEDMLRRYGREPRFEFWLSGHMSALETPRPLPVQHPHIVLEIMARDPKQHDLVMAWHRPEYISENASCLFYASLLDKRGVLPKDSSWRDCSSRLVTVIDAQSIATWDAYIEGHASLDLYVLRHHPLSGPFLGYLAERFVDEVWIPKTSHMQRLFLSTLARAAALADSTMVSRMLSHLDAPIRPTMRDMAYGWVCFLAPFHWRRIMHDHVAFDADSFYSFVTLGLGSGHIARVRTRSARDIERMLARWMPDLVSGEGFDRAWKEGRI